MVNFSILEKVRKSFGTTETPLMSKLIAKMHETQPYVGKHIVYNAHMTLSSLLQLEALFASGANVTITVADGLKCDMEAVKILHEAGIHITPYAELSNLVCDAALDCCGKLLYLVQSKFGVSELTQTGVVRYKNSELHYPVISIDDTKVKNLETLFGTGDGFVRAFRSLTKGGLHSKRFVVFGYGKVGKGIVSALSKFTSNIIIIEIDPIKVQEAQNNGLFAYSLLAKKDLLPFIQDAYCVVTATGQKNLISDYFGHENFNAKYLANMGSEDEWGYEFLESEILNNKLAINFSLPLPTRVLFLDAIFYAQVIALEELFKNDKVPGIYYLPPEQDATILIDWIANQYRIHLEGDYLQSIISNIPTHIYWKDLDSVYLGCNELFAKAAGCQSPSEVIGKTDYELAWGETEADMYRKGDLDAFEGKTLLNFEETQYQANGQNSVVLASKVPYRDELGNIIGVLGIFMDITERKKQEEELRLAKEKAEMASQAKTQFLAVASHELRVPLTGVLSVADMIVNGTINTMEEAREYAKIILESGQYLLSNIDSILYYAKLESEKYVLNPEVVDLNKFILKLASAFIPMAQQKSLKFETGIAGNVPESIEVDSVALRHIISNLISNAIRYTDKGAIKLEVSCLKLKKAKALIEIAIYDTGVGIPADKLESIFEKFTQIEDAYVRKNSRSGFGLGLSIVKKFVDVLEGKIIVESAIGKGSVFKFQAEYDLPSK